MKGELVQGGSRLWRSAVSYFHDWQRRSTLQKELQALGAEGDRVLHDCGMSRGEYFSSLQTSLVSVDLLSPAMESLGLDRAELGMKHLEWSRDLERSCMSCRHRRRCREDVLAGRFAARHSDYCVNGDSFEELATACRYS